MKDRGKYNMITGKWSGQKQRRVVRVIMHLGDATPWFGHENDRHNVGELLQVLEHATGAIQLHAPDGEPEERIVFDVLPPAGVDDANWARMEAERMSSFGYNAVSAPEWPNVDQFTIGTRVVMRDERDGYTERGVVSEVEGRDMYIVTVDVAVDAGDDRLREVHAKQMRKE